MNQVTNRQGLKSDKAKLNKVIQEWMSFMNKTMHNKTFKGVWETTTVIIAYDPILGFDEARRTKEDGLTYTDTIYDEKASAHNTLDNYKKALEVARIDGMLFMYNLCKNSGRKLAMINGVYYDETPASGQELKFKRELSRYKDLLKVL